MYVCLCLRFVACIDPDSSFLLGSNGFWLKADIKENGSRVVATKDVKEADHFYIIPSKNSFSIEYRSGPRMCVSLVGYGETDDAVLLKAPKGNQVSFVLATAQDNTPVNDLSNWCRKPLLIQQVNTGIFKFLQTTYYLSVVPAYDQAYHRVTSCSKASLASSTKQTQFHIRKPPKLNWFAFLQWQCNWAAWHGGNPCTY